MRSNQSGTPADSELPCALTPPKSIVLYVSTIRDISRLRCVFNFRRKGDPRVLFNADFGRVCAHFTFLSGLSLYTHGLLAK